MGQCSVCGHETKFGSVDYGTKCIFHCDKDDQKWEYRKSPDVKRFWKAIREKHTKKEDFQFHKYVFPVFESRGNLEVHESLWYKYCDITCEDGWNFFVPDEHGRVFLHFTEVLHFTEAVFAHDTDFKYISFSDQCYFNQVEFKKDTFFEESRFIKNAVFNSAKFMGDAHFGKSVFDDFVIFKKAIFTQKALFNETIFNNEVDFSETYFSGLTAFYKTRFFIKLNFARSEHQETYFKDCVFKDNNCVIDKLTIKYKMQFSSINRFESLIFQNITIEDKASLIVQDIKCDHFSITRLNNKGSGNKLTNITINKELEINHAIFDKTEFNGFDVSKASSITLENTSFVGSYLTNIEWGTINNDRFKVDRKMARQLKFINEAQGDVIDANEFYALEMKLHGIDLKKDKTLWREKLVHFVHEAVSNHSSDWFLALLWFLTVGFFSVVLTNNVIPYESIFVLLLILFLWIYVKKTYQPIKAFIVITGLLYWHSVTTLQLPHYGVDLLFAMINPLAIKTFDVILKDIPSYILYPTRLIEIFIGYQFITAIRKNTRRK